MSNKQNGHIMNKEREEIILKDRDRHKKHKYDEKKESHGNKKKIEHLEKEKTLGNTDDGKQRDKYDKKEQKHKKEKNRDGDTGEYRTRKREKSRDRHEKRDKSEERNEKKDRYKDRSEKKHIDKHEKKTKKDENYDEYQEKSDSKKKDKDRSRERKKEKDSSNKKSRHKDREKSHDKHRYKNRDRRSRHEEHNENDLEVKENPDRKKTKDCDENKNNEEIYDYEDDFENYDDDFEDDDEDRNSKTSSEKEALKINKNSKDTLEEVQKSIEIENNELLKSPKNGESSNKKQKNNQFDSLYKEVKMSDFFINFSKDQQYQSSNVSKTMKKRAMDISRWVDIEQSPTINLFFLPPNHSMRRNISFATTQTRDNDVERGSQTEMIDHLDRSAQYPPVFDSNQDEQFYQKEDSSFFNDTTSLAKFVSNSLPLLIDLLMEDQTRNKLRFKEKSNLLNCHSKTTLVLPEIIKDRPVEKCQFSPYSSKWFLTLHSIPPKISSETDWSLRGLVCVWNLYALEAPYRILSCLAEPMCCCFSPGQASMVFAGMADGAIIMWDLKRPSVNKRLQNPNILVPSYNTTFDKANTHNSPVISITTIQPNKLQSESTLDPDDFQVVSLEENSAIFVWSPIKVNKDVENYEDLTGNDNTSYKNYVIFQSTTSHYILVKSHFISLFPKNNDSFSSVQSSFMLVPTNQHNHLYVACNNGKIVQVSKHSYSKTSVRYYCPSQGALCDVSCFSVSNSDPQLILAGYVDGSWRVFGENSGFPVFEHIPQNSSPIKSISWNHSNLNILVWADEENKVYLWNSHEETTKPIKSYDISCKIKSFELSNSLNDQTSKFMAICFEVGRVEIHFMDESFTQMNKETYWEKMLKI